MAGLTSALSLGAIWLRPSKMTVFPHLGPLNTQVPISLPWTNRIPLVMIWNITNLLRVKSNRVSPLLGLHLPSHSFTTTSPHADHSSEVVIVGGVLGGECVCVCFDCLNVWVGVCLCMSVYAFQSKTQRIRWEAHIMMLLHVLLEGTFLQFVYSINARAHQC